MTVEGTPIDDAINVVKVIAKCETPDTDADLRKLAWAARRLVREVRLIGTVQAKVLLENLRQSHHGNRIRFTERK